MRLGALCAGVGGLELALNHNPTWVAETDPTASHILEQHWPDAPNIGDLTTATPPPADIITAGFPCQPVSTAGQRKGTQDERWLIDDICEVVRRSGAHTLYLENVAGLLSANSGDAMAHVCAALASIGFDAEWTTLRASDIGAPHHRNRWFCIATDPTRQGLLQGAVGQVDEGRSPGPTSSDIPAATHPDSLQPERRRGPAAMASEVRTARQQDRGSDQSRHPPRHSASTATHPDSDRQQSIGRRHPVRCDPDRCHGETFGPYLAAVQRWERILGRPAPNPLTDNRLNPVFVEWMMGLPDGWVTNHTTTRTAALRVLGNGVVPQQATTAYHHLHRRHQQ